MIGVLGGMGPLASAEFLKTIYESNIAGDCEQNAPQVVVYSDPSFPDRTQALLRGDETLLLKSLTDALQQLYNLNATEIVMCCITSHYLLPKLSPRLRKRIICLVDTILTSIIDQRIDCLLLCTTGTRKLGVFSQNPHWEKAKGYISLLSAADQKAVHDIIYQLKSNVISRQTAVHAIERLAHKYGVKTVIAGCTELHLLSKLNSRHINFLDPLTLLAQTWASGQNNRDDLKQLPEIQIMI